MSDIDVLKEAERAAWEFYQDAKELRDNTEEGKAVTEAAVNLLMGKHMAGSKIEKYISALAECTLANKKMDAAEKAYFAWTMTGYSRETRKEVFGATQRAAEEHSVKKQRLVKAAAEFLKYYAIKKDRKNGK